jgi:hypothetical protein
LGKNKRLAYSPIHIQMAFGEPTEVVVQVFVASLP